MAWIKDIYNDTDIFTDNSWARVEVRFTESGFSRFARFMGLATTSLALRLVEHYQKLPPKVLQSTFLANPVEAAKIASLDLGQKQTFDTFNPNRSVTALDVQEQLARLALRLMTEVELPAEEVWAAQHWINVIDRMRASNLESQDNNDLDPIVKHLDFASKLAYVRKHVADPEMQNAYNAKAVARSILWDRFMPEGPGILYWNNQVYGKGRGDDPIGQELIDHLVMNPPEGSRAFMRGEAITAHNKGANLFNVGWSFIARANRMIPLRPYQTQLDREWNQK